MFESDQDEAIAGRTMGLAELGAADLVDDLIACERSAFECRDRLRRARGKSAAIAAEIRRRLEGRPHVFIREETAVIFLPELAGPRVIPFTDLDVQRIEAEAEDYFDNIFRDATALDLHRRREQLDRAAALALNSTPYEAAEVVSLMLARQILPAGFAEFGKVCGDLRAELLQCHLDNRKPVVQPGTPKDVGL